MKIEVDLSNPSQLRETRAELQRMIDVIDFALGRQQGAAVPRITLQDQDSVRAENVNRTTADRIRQAIDSAPVQFKSSEIYRQFPEPARTAIKEEFKKRVQDKTLRIVEMGEGRRATVYEKTPQNLV